MSEKQAALFAAAMTAAVLTVAVALPSSGIEPFGKDAIQDQTVREDRAFCAKFRLLDTNDPRSGECMADLANLRQQHERLLVEYSLF